MEFTEKIVPDLNRMDFAADGKEDALRKIAAIAAEVPDLADVGEEAIYTALAEREKSASTGLGGGVAIPHARFKGLTDFVVFVLVAPKGVDFESLDKRKVQLFFVVLAPEENVNEHLKILASISRTLSQANIKKELLAVQSTKILMEVLIRASGVETVKPAEGSKKKLLFIILYYEDNLQQVLEYLIDQGIEGATVFETKGMGAYVSAMPLFTSFLDFMREDRTSSRTVMTMIPAEAEGHYVNGIEKIVGDLDKTQGAMIMTLDVSFSKGTMNML